MESSVIDTNSALYKSAWEAAESMRKHRMLLDKIASDLEKPDSGKPISTVNTLTARRNAAKIRLIVEKKTALDRVKVLGVGESFTVPMTMANNIRVACSYQKSTYLKEFRTEKFKFNRVEYLKVLRTS